MLRILKSAAFLVVLIPAMVVATATSAPAPLADAAMNGNMDAVRTLLRQHADVNAPQGDGTTALHWAAYRDDIDMARLLIASGADVNAKTRVGNITPMFMAAKNGDALMIELLLKAGVDSNATDTNGTTALMYAAISGHAEAAEVLLNHGANPNATDNANGQTAMMFAAASGRAGVIKALASRGADANIRTKVSEVIKYNERVRQRDEAEKEKKAKEAALHPEAVKNPATPADKPKQTEEDDPDNKRPAKPAEKIFMGGMTALLFAAREGHLDAARELVDAGADVNLVSASDHISALTEAIINGHFDLANFLVDHDANPNLATDYGLAPLYAVIDTQWAERTWYPAPTVDEEETNHLELLKSLLVHGANPNARLIRKPWFRTEHGDWVNPSGATPFWLAAKANDVPAMQMLLGAGADPSIPNNGGITPLIVAAGYGYEPQVTHFAPGARLAAVRYLVEDVGLNVNAKDNNGYTPLHGAALMADKDVILYLVGKGADIHARASQIFGGTGKADQKLKDESGDTVADMANGPRPHNLQFPEIVDLLVKLGSKNSNNCRASTCVVKTAAPQQH